MSDDFNEPGTDEASGGTASVLRSIGGEFRGQKLHPATAMVQAIAQGMGMKWPFIGRDALDQYEATGVYPGAIIDTVIFTYLRTLDREGLESAAIAPRRAFAAAMDWMSEMKISPGSAAFRDAFAMFRQTMIDISESTSEPDLPRSGKKKASRKRG